MHDFKLLNFYKIHNDGTNHSKHYVGRIMIKNGVLQVLEDNHRILKGIFKDGPMDQVKERRLHDFESGRNGYLTAVSAELDSEPTEVQSRPPSVFHFQLEGGQPHVVKFHTDGKMTLDDNPVDPDHLKTILQLVKDSKAVLQYSKTVIGEVKKMEAPIEVEGSPEREDLPIGELFSKIRSVTQDGHLDPNVEKCLRKLIFTDKMCGNVGNKYAFQDFLSRPKAGVIISADINNFKNINDSFGHQTGDEAIVAAFKAIREAVDESVGRDKAKVFRVDDQDVWRPGGDEAVIACQNPEQAAAFARLLRNKLEEIPPIGGVHKLSFSLGFGPDYQTADKALLEAKKQKLNETGEERWQAGQVPMLIHSLIPGQEGPVPTTDA